MSEQPQRNGTISHMGIVDLTWAESEEDLAGITGFENIGVLRVAPKLYRYVISKPMRNVGLVEQADPTRGPRQEVTGQARLTGAYLASGDAETTLEVMGQLIVMPPLEAIGFKQLRVMGQLIVPRGSEAILSAKLGSLHGNIIYYPADKGAPRLFMGKEVIGREYLELLPEPAPWVIMGTVTLADDVTPDLLRAKVPEIALMGTLIVPEGLLALAQVLTPDKAGTVRVAGAAPEPKGAEASPWGKKE